MLSRKSTVAMALIVGLSMAMAASAEITLRIGDPAPKLQVAKWVKGEPVKGFEKGKIYIVEFWATWCPPCRASIPHMTETQKKYADKGVICIGQDLREDEAKVTPFVEQMGDKMNYRVALENDAAMTRSWLEAAGENGIPCAFIVNRDTKIAWIGHPMTMDKALEEIVAGKWDIAAAAAEKAKETAAAEHAMETAKSIAAARMAKDWDKVIELTDAAIKDQPQMELNYLMQKMDAQLNKGDSDGGYATVRHIADKYDNVPMALNAMAWRIVSLPGLKNRDLDLAMKLAERANEKTGGANPSVLDTLAKVYDAKGDVDKAIATETTAVEKAPEQLKGRFETTLKEYQAKKTK